MKKVCYLVIGIIFSLASFFPVYAEDLRVKDTQNYLYDDLKADLTVLAETYQGIPLEIDCLGKTFDDRELYHIIVGNPYAKKHLLVIGAIHGREYITARLVMMQMVDLLENYYEYAEDLKYAAIHFVPMSNPDGVTISQLGLDGLNHRYTRQSIYQIYENDNASELEPYLEQWKANAKGVDINRNFDALWAEYQWGSPRASSDCFKGTEPHSEAESFALVQLTQKYPFTATISYHTQGQVIYWYFGQSGDCLGKSQDLANMASEVTGYPTYANYKDIDPAGYKDWALSAMEIPSLTIEVGTGINPINPNQFSEIWNQNKQMIPKLLKWIKK